MNEIWLAGRVTAVTDQGQVWEVQGIFPDEEAAKAACRDTTYFIVPLPWNVSLPHETIEEPRGYFPLAPQS